MKKFERFSIWIRHSPLLKEADSLWAYLRPIYQRVIGILGHSGLERVINGSERMVVSPEARGVTEQYEPEVWRAVMAEIRKGDTFVDVGAYIGLYSIAVGLRLRGVGHVIAFEPDERSFRLLGEHVRLNGLQGCVEMHQVAVSDRTGKSYFFSNGTSEARIVSAPREDTTLIPSITLDEAVAGRRVDVLKIDVEGYEESVLRGASRLLSTPEHRPRAIFIEVHPDAWSTVKTTSVSLLKLLEEAGYLVETVDGGHVRSIDCYGEIVARVGS
jgi:FkbM family methyltransferase